MHTGTSPDAMYTMSAAAAPVSTSLSPGCMHACPAAQGTCTLAIAAGSHNMMAPGPAVNQQHSSCMAGACGVHLQAAVYTHLPMQTVLPMQPIAQNGCTAEHTRTRTGVRTTARIKHLVMPKHAALWPQGWVPADQQLHLKKLLDCSHSLLQPLQNYSVYRASLPTASAAHCCKMETCDTRPVTNLGNSTLVLAMVEKQVWSI